MHNTKIHLCKDGSHTLYSEKFHQHYHNPNGAIAESRYIFFEIPDLIKNIKRSNSYRIFEVGFGTGLNLLLLIDYLPGLKSKTEIIFRSVEAYPLTLHQIMQLNYPEKLELSNAAEILACIFRNLNPGMNQIQVKKNILLELFIGPFNQHPDPGYKFNSIFFDPFSPDANPDLWSEKVFKKMALWSDPDVLLSTYCAASSARAAMASAGWKIARAPGSIGKREMTLAALDPEKLNGYKRIDEVRLAKRYDNGEFLTG